MPVGEQADTNVQGEVQQQLDVLCNTLMLRAFCSSSDIICAVASEEEPLPRSCADVMGYHYDNIFKSGEYVAVFDPIDGSKNIDASLPVGTVFGIYRSPDQGVRDEHGKGWSLDSFLQRGTRMVAAGYCLYSWVIAVQCVYCAFQNTFWWYLHRRESLLTQQSSFDRTSHCYEHTS